MESDPSESQQNRFNWLEIDASDLLFLAQRHRKSLIIAPLIGFILAFAIAKMLPPVFSTKAVIYLRPNFDREMQLERTSSKHEDSDSLRSIERSIISDSVILNMVDTLGLRNDDSFFGESVPEGGLPDAVLLEKIRDRYKTDLVPTTRLVELRVDDYSSDRVTEIANTLIDEYLKLLREDRNGKEQELRDTLLVQAEKALKGAMEAEEHLKRFRLEHPATFVEQDSAVFHERLLQCSGALNKANSESSRLAGAVSALTLVDPEQDPYRVFQVLNNRNSEYLSELLGMEAKSKAEFAAVKERVTEQHRDYLVAAGRLEEVERTLKKYAADMKTGLESEYQAATEEAESMKRALDDLQQEFVTFKTASAEFRGLKEESDRNWNTSAKLQQKIMDLDLDPEVNPTFITVVSAPIVPDQKSKPRTLFWVAGGSFFGGIIALGLIYRKNRNGLPFTSVEQAGARLGSAAVTQLSSPPSGNLWTEKTELELLDVLIALREAKITHVTSMAGAKETGELPEALARNAAARGSRSLLVSLDSRLRNAPPIEPDGKLDNLSRLQVPSASLLNPTEFDDALKNLMQTFDSVFIDTTGVHAVEAKLAVAGLADANVIAIRDSEGEPRSSYQRFADECARAGRPPVVVYVHKEDSPKSSPTSTRSRSRREAPNPSPKPGFVG